MNDTVKMRPFTIDELRAYLVEIFPEFWKGRRSSRRRHRADERHGAPHPSCQTFAAGRDDLGPGHVRSLRRRAVRGDPGRDRSRRACGHHQRFDQFPPQAHARRSHRQDEAAQARQTARCRRNRALSRRAVWSPTPLRPIRLPARGERVRTRPGLFGGSKRSVGRVRGGIMIPHR